MDLPLKSRYRIKLELRNFESWFQGIKVLPIEVQPIKMKAGICEFKNGRGANTTDLDFLHS